MPESAEEATSKKKGGKMKLVIPVVVVVLALGGGGFFFMSASSKKAAATGPTTSTTLVPGPVIVLQPITTNLSDGHVLKVGLSLRLSSKPKDKKLVAIVAAAAAPAAGSSSSSSTASPMDGEESVALDLAITVLGDDTYTSLSSPDGKAAAKADLTQKIKAAYNGDVTDVYYNDFVMS